MFFSNQTVRKVVFAMIIGIAVLSGTAVAENQSSQQDTPESIRDSLGKMQLHDYFVEDGDAVIEATWTGEMSTSLTVVEMVDMQSGGSQKISFKRVHFIPGQRQTIRIAVADESPSLLLSTPESIENDDALMIQIGDTSIFSGPADWRTAQISGIVGFSGGFIAMILVAYHRVRGGKTGVERVA